LPEDEDDEMPLAWLAWPGAICCFDAHPRENVQSFSHVQLKLNTGDMVIVRGDLVHGGAAFDNLNVRVHAYLDPTNDMYLEWGDWIFCRASRASQGITAQKNGSIKEKEIRIIVAL
jgi:hypothetical protein